MTDQDADQGQGGAQAIEDGVSLAALLPLGTSADEIQDRLKLYEQCRYERAHQVLPDYAVSLGTY